MLDGLWLGVVGCGWVIAGLAKGAWDLGESIVGFVGLRGVAMSTHILVSHCSTSRRAGEVMRGRLLPGRKTG